MEIIELFWFLRRCFWRLRRYRWRFLRFWRSLYYAITNALILIVGVALLTGIWYFCFFG